MIKEILLPSIGEGVESADVSDVLVKTGDSIVKDGAILILESEKATMEIPSEFSGKVLEVFIKTGDKISAGQKLISVEISDSKVESTPSNKETEESPIEKGPPKPSLSEQKIETSPQATIVPSINKAPFASPGVRRFARELGAGLQYVQGSGAKGRILKEDVQSYIKAQLAGQSALQQPAQPPVDFSAWGPIENISLNKIRRITGERMTSAWQTIPQVTNFDKVDITELDALRRSMQKATKKGEAKITLLPFIMKACTKALKEFPKVNSSLSLSAEELILKKYYHIRVAIDTPEGLMVPVIRDIDKKDIFEISKDLAETSKKARNKRLMPDDLAGGTFTISSLGGIGGTYFTPIVNPPEVAILGVSRAQMEQVYNGKVFDNKLMLPVTLSYDHRVIDGAMAARFMKYLNELLSDTKKLSKANIL